MRIKIAYGKEYRSVDVMKKNIGAVMYPKGVETELSEQELIEKSLAAPIGTPTLDRIIRRGESVVLITSDITRPLPSSRILPTLLEHLGKIGIKEEDITIVFGLGNHRKQTEGEMKKIVGSEIYRRIRRMDSDQEDVVRLGITARGTPLDIFRPVAEADRVICLGNIDYHYFAGYSGGYKAIMPGVSTEEAIRMNHRHMVKESAATGKVKGNPVREDIEAIAQYLKVDFILNVVLNEHKKIVGSFAGHPISAHRAGCKLLDSFCRYPIDRKADIALVSAGGFPHDINLYQVQKALDNGKYAVRDGGIIILVAACNEGPGESTFEKWMVESGSPEFMVKEIQRNFVLGGHKAAAIGLVLEKAEILIVSEMSPDFVERIFMKPFRGVREALDRAIEKMGPHALVHVMPVGGSTLPLLIE